MGHCCSCDKLRATDTSIAAEVLAEADEYGTVVPKTKHLAPIARKLDNAIHWIKLYTVDTLIASQSVPGWSAFNALLYPESPEIGVVGY